MGPRIGNVYRTACLVALLGASSGCSLLFVTKAPPPSPARARDDQDQSKKSSRSKDCTTSQWAPILDSVVSGYQIYRTVYAVAAPDSAYTNTPISRGADVALGLAFTTLFLGSASYGFAATRNCRELRAHEAVEARARPKRSRRHVPLESDDPAEEASANEPLDEELRATSIGSKAAPKQHLDDAKDTSQTPAVDSDSFSPW